MENNAWLILIAIIAYILGSIPTAYFVTKAMTGKDVRLAGSGNIGAMNCYRLIRAEKSTKLGIAGFALAFVGDMGKGALAIFTAEWLSFLNYTPTLALIIGSFFVILGHNYSLFLKFRGGGRGLAPLGGIVLSLNPLLVPIGLGVFLAALFLVHYLVGGKIDGDKPSAVFSAAGSQIVGRIVGIIIALVPMYLLSPETFFPILAALVLILIKHIERVKVYIRELRASRQ